MARKPYGTGNRAVARGPGRTHYVGRGKVGTGDFAHAWAHLLQEAVERAEPIVLELPSDPHPAAQRLLATLGVLWRVGP